MASGRSDLDSSPQDGADALGDAFRQVEQGLARLQEVVRLQGWEAGQSTREALRLQIERTERGVQEALRRQQEEQQRRTQEALRLHQEETERRVQEALRAQAQEAEGLLGDAVRQMELKVREKDDAIRALQRGLQETRDRVAVVEEKIQASTDSRGESDLQRLQNSEKVIESIQHYEPEAVFPRSEVISHELKEPLSTDEASPFAASAREAVATGDVAGGREGNFRAPSPFPATSSSAAAGGSERERQRVELRVQEVRERAEAARTSPSLPEEQLCLAVSDGRVDDVQRLLSSGVDVNCTDRFGTTPLLRAVYDPVRTDAVRLLVQRGADANAVTISGSSALHWASMNDRSGRCVALLVGSGADVNARNKDGATPLHWAAWVKNTATVRALLAAGARWDLEAWDGAWKGRTPFHVAPSSPSSEAREFQWP